MSHDEITAAEFAAYAQVKQDHIRYLRRRLRADREVEQYLAHQSARLGRPATMGEFRGGSNGSTRSGSPAGDGSGFG